MSRLDVTICHITGVISRYWHALVTWLCTAVRAPYVTLRFFIRRLRFAKETSRTHSGNISHCRLWSCKRFLVLFESDINLFLALFGSVSRLIFCRREPEVNRWLRIEAWWKVFTTLWLWGACLQINSLISSADCEDFQWVMSEQRMLFEWVRNRLGICRFNGCCCIDAN